MLRVRSFTDIVLGDAIPNRTCGECTACCTLAGIEAPELSKPESVTCPHCIAGGGCGIYESRPAVCRTYFCGWRRIALPEECRPDRLGVMLHLMHPKPAPNLLMRVYIKAIPLTSWDDVPWEKFEPVLAVLRRAKLPVWREVNGTLALEHPLPAIARIILKGAKPNTRRIAAEAQEWVRIHSEY